MTGIERLRRLASDMRDSGWQRMHDDLAKIADLIEREYGRSAETVRSDAMEAWRWVRKRGGLATLELHEETFADMMRQRDEYRAIARDYEREATWVREHGGLDAMVELSSRLMTVDALRAAIEETCTRIGVEHTGDLTQDAQAIWREIGALRSRLKESVPRAAYERHLARRQRQIDESHAALRRRNARIVFLVSELNRANHENHEEFMRHAGDFTAFTDEVCKRLAPELRYVEGCSKDVMDAALEALDRRLMPEGGWPRYEDGEMVLVGSDIADELGETHTVTSIEFLEDETLLHWNPDEPEECVWVGRGERVRRPAPKGLDADGVEIRVGDTVWHVETGEQCKVVEVDSRSVSVDFRVDGDGTKHTGSILPANLTHRAPVLAADGRPLREGEQVWHVETGTELVVKELPKPGAYQAVVVFASPASHLTSFDPDHLTHERPVSDTWERLEEDVAGASCPDVYCANHHVDASDTSYEWTMARDIVRRAKALAGRSE